MLVLSHPQLYNGLVMNPIGESLWLLVMGSSVRYSLFSFARSPFCSFPPSRFRRTRIGGQSSNLGADSHSPQRRFHSLLSQRKSRIGLPRVFHLTKMESRGSPKSTSGFLVFYGTGERVGLGERALGRERGEPRQSLDTRCACFTWGFWDAIKHSGRA